MSSKTRNRRLGFRRRLSLAFYKTADKNQGTSKPGSRDPTRRRSFTPSQDRLQELRRQASLATTESVQLATRSSVLQNPPRITTQRTLTEFFRSRRCSSVPDSVRRSYAEAATPASPSISGLTRSRLRFRTPPEARNPVSPPPVSPLQASKQQQQQQMDQEAV